MATLELIDVAGRVIPYHYRVDINLRDYTVRTHQEPVIALLDGWRCDGNDCFEAHNEAVYEHRDINGAADADAGRFGRRLCRGAARRRGPLTAFRRPAIMKTANGVRVVKRSVSCVCFSLPRGLGPSP